MRMLDLYSGRWGWSKAFAARGWECVGVDLTVPPDVPEGCRFLQKDVLSITPEWLLRNDMGFDFICASSPCEQFSVHGMKHFHPNPPYPELGIKLFNHTRQTCEASGVPYVMENVRAAQQFVGQAVNHCGPFYLWGNAVPPLIPQGITKGFTQARNVKGATKEQLKAWRQSDPNIRGGSALLSRILTAQLATIPPELSACVANYAEAVLRESVTT